MFVPEPLPDSEENAGNPEAKERGNTKPLQAANNGVVYRDIEETERHKLFQHFFVPLLTRRIAKCQIVLDKIIQRPTHKVGYSLRNQPMPVKQTVEKRKH